MNEPEECKPCQRDQCPLECQHLARRRLMMADRGDFIDGAEALREEMIKSVNVLFIAHIEGVFAVFAKRHGFEPKDIDINEIRSGE